MNNKEYIKLWSNDKKRREFIADYKKYAVLNHTMEDLELEFFGVVLPSGDVIWALEHMATNYSYLTKQYGEKSIRVKYYYQDKEWFEPSAVSDSFISEKLKALKIELQEGKWQ